MEQSVFDWFLGRMKEEAGEITVTTVWDTRREIMVIASNLFDILHNGTTEEIIGACAQMSVLSLAIADKARFGSIE